MKTTPCNGESTFSNLTTLRYFGFSRLQFSAWPWGRCFNALNGRREDRQSKWWTSKRELVYCAQGSTMNLPFQIGIFFFGFFAREK
jgi:hypothetical protein